MGKTKIRWLLYMADDCLGTAYDICLLERVNVI
jgi:hypothetical protein